MYQDLRHAVRVLSAHRGFSVAALLTLALGIGASTAIYSVVYGVLLRPLPYPDPDRLVQISEEVPGGNPALRGSWVSNLTLEAWRPARTTLTSVATFGTGAATVGFDPPVRVPRSSVSTSFFDVLGVRPLHGRFFAEQDAADGAAPVVIVSAPLWRDRFAADPSAIGRTLQIDDRPHTIIGVAPSGVEFPARDTALWTATRVRPSIAKAGDSPRVEALRAIARLAPGATPAAAEVEGTAAAGTIVRPLAADMLFGKGGPVIVHVRTVADQMTSTIRPALLVLLAGVGVLLLIACANVANLTLSRGVSREREVAVRVALGAGSGRLLRQLLAETVVLAAAGGALGVALAWGLLQLLPLVAFERFPRVGDIRLDLGTLAFAVGASLAAVLLAGLAPAIRGARPDLLIALREGSGASSSTRITTLRRALLVSEAALAVMLLVAASLLARSFVRLLDVDPGYDARNVATARIYLPGAARGEADTEAFIDALLQRVRALPGVAAAGATNMAPLGESTFVAGFTVPVPGRQPVTVRALSYVVTPGYAEALGLRLHRGRMLDETDRAAATERFVINEEFARSVFGGINPVGQRLGERSEIVGVVGNVLKDGLTQPPQAEFYQLPVHGQRIRREINLVLRSDAPLQHAAAIRQLVRELRADAAVGTIATLESQVARSIAEQRFAASVLSGFAALAVLLAAIGLYGVLSYMVSRRRREIGVRMALGAPRARLVALVIREGAGVVAVGLLLGAAGAAAVTRLMQSLLFGVEPLDPWAFAAGSSVLLVVTLIACAVPARRAAGVDPAIALRCE